MTLFTLDQLEAAVPLVRSLVAPTPAYAWPLLARRTGVQVVVKHENHTPTGAFKLRGGLTFADALRRSGSPAKGLVTATRGNHGQSVAIAGTRLGLPVLIVVPEGNSPEKNAAMAAFGGEVIVAGRDFDASRAVAAELEAERGLRLVPPFHPDLVVGVATYALELFSAEPELAAVYVPIGMGSGICGLITVRELMGLKTEIVGVVAEGAPAVALSFDAGRVVETEAARTFADGMACREPNRESFEIIREGAARVVTVTEDEIAEAIRQLHTDTHNLAEGAGAAPLAALTRERARYQGRRVGLIQTGGNIDMDMLATVLGGGTPAA